MDEVLKNNEAGGEATNEVASLAEMPSFAEHMAKRAEEEKNKETREYEEAAIHSIAAKLDIDENDLEKAVFEGGNEKIFEEAAEKVEEKFNDDFIEDTDESIDNKEYFVLGILSDIHDKWCANNEDAFFDPELSDERYKFLDFSLIGFSDATSYLKFATPILEKIGVEIDEENLREQFDDYPGGIDAEWCGLKEDYGAFPNDVADENDNFTDDGSYMYTGCVFAQTLYDRPSEYLSRGASEKIRTSIKGDFDIASAMTMQVGENCDGVGEADYGSLWAYHERGEDGLYEYWFENYDPFDPFDTSELDNDPYFTSQEYINDGWN